MANRSGFMCYHRAADLLCSLPDEATGQIFKALLVYSRDGIVTDFSEHPASAFMSAIFNEQKRFLDEDSARYDAICATKAKAAHDRWKKKALQAHEPESTGMHMHADACTSTGMHGGASKIDANDANKQLAISNLKEIDKYKENGKAAGAFHSSERGRSSGLLSGTQEHRERGAVLRLLHRQRLESRQALHERLESRCAFMGVQRSGERNGGQ